MPRLLCLVHDIVNGFALDCRRYSGGRYGELETPADQLKNSSHSSSEIWESMLSRTKSLAIKSNALLR